jgi:hypothetical protein
MVTRGRTAVTAGKTATRSPTTTSAVSRAAVSTPSTTTTTTTTGSGFTRKVITQQPAGQEIQAQFKQAVSSAVQSVGIDFGVATVKTTVQETPTEIITIIDKPEEEVIVEEVIEEEIPEEIEVIEEKIPEEIEVIEEEIPEVFGEIEVVLTDQVKQIISDIENGIVLVPDWFVKNIDWVKTGQITQQEFVTAYNYAVDQGWIHAPTEQEKEVIEKEKEKEVTKKPSPTNGRFSGASALGLVAVLVLMGAAVTVFKKEGN